MGFEACHPAVNLIFFSAVLFGTLSFRHPVFLMISFLCAAAYGIKRNGRRTTVFLLCLLPCILAFALYYSSFHHFGMTVLKRNFIGNNMTMEALIYGILIGFSIAGALIWMSCIYSVFTSDKVVFLFGKVSPKLSLFLAILLRMVPKIKQEAKRIHTARKGLGKGINQGNILQRIKNGICIFSILISWCISAFAVMSDSMQSRGSTLRGRTAFSIYRFDHRDRAFVLLMFGCLILTGMAMLLGWTDMVYDPLILPKPIPEAALPYPITYACLCLMPLALEIWTDLRFATSQSKQKNDIEKQLIM